MNWDGLERSYELLGVDSPEKNGAGVGGYVVEIQAVGFGVDDPLRDKLVWQIGIQGVCRFECVVSNAHQASDTSNLVGCFVRCCDEAHLKTDDGGRTTLEGKALGNVVSSGRSVIKIGYEKAIWSDLLEGRTLGPVV